MILISILDLMMISCLFWLTCFIMTDEEYNIIHSEELILCWNVLMSGHSNVLHNMKE